MKLTSPFFFKLGQIDMFCLNNSVSDRHQFWGDIKNLLYWKHIFLNCSSKVCIKDDIWHQFVNILLTVLKHLQEITIFPEGRVKTNSLKIWLGVGPETFQDGACQICMGLNILKKIASRYMKWGTHYKSKSE